MVPSRSGLAALSDAVRAIVPAVAVGFARPVVDERVSVLFSDSFRLSEYVVPVAEVPEALRPATEGIAQTPADAIEANGDRAIEWQLTASGVRHVISFLAGGPGARFWIGLPASH